jgi:hypothetical protein
MRILCYNKISGGVFSYSSQHSKYPWADAIADTRLSRWGKFTSNTNQYLQWYFATATTIFYAYILKTNLASTATVKLQCSNDNFATVTEYALTQYGNGWMLFAEAGLTYKYFRIFVSDSTVTYPRISKPYIGGYLEMPAFERTPSIGYKSTSKSDKNDTGQLYGYTQVRLKTYSITYPLIDHDTRVLIDAAFDTLDKVVPFVALIYHDDLLRFAPLYCNMTDDIEYQQIDMSGLFYKATQKLEECR